MAVSPESPSATHCCLSVTQEVGPGLVELRPGLPVVSGKAELTAVRFLSAYLQEGCSGTPATDGSTSVMELRASRGGGRSSGRHFYEDFYFTSSSCSYLTSCLVRESSDSEILASAFR